MLTEKVLVVCDPVYKIYIIIIIKTFQLYRIIKGGCIIVSFFPEQIRLIQP